MNGLRTALLLAMLAVAGCGSDERVVIPDKATPMTEVQPNLAQPPAPAN